MVAEEHPFIGRMVILAVVELMGGGDAAVIEDGDASGKESAVIAVGDGQDAEDEQHERHRPQHLLAVDGIEEQVCHHLLLNLVFLSPEGAAANRGATPGTQPLVRNPWYAT